MQFSEPPLFTKDPKRVMFDRAVQIFCDENLKPGMCYSSKGVPFSNYLVDGNDAVLAYQDGTACSASFALSDVYRKSDNTYIVVTDTGHAHFTGDDPSNHTDLHVEECATLEDVLIELTSFCGHDPNSTGDMLIDVFDRSILKSIFNKDGEPAIFDLVKDREDFQACLAKMETNKWRYQRN